ncbi:MAG: class I adenylate-forming enzyme family protein [Tissierellia bacterium]|nr:class I adenylate-forming enzyme family protein [Tissierellia bacterium]
MIITDILVKNAKEFPDEISLVEVSPEIQEQNEKEWKEFELVEPGKAKEHRREITWGEFNERANKVAGLLMDKGIKKGDKVAILLMNCLEWLPIYFGILKTGALVVPMNFRYTSEEIKYCLKLSEADALVFGEEFIERVDSIKGCVNKVKSLIYVGEHCPTFASSYNNLINQYNIQEPKVEIFPQDDAAIYFSSGTTGFPKGILHTHSGLLSTCYTENNNHGQTKDDVFLCIPPFYHTGAKMHYFGSYLVGGKGVILKGVKPEWILKTVSEEKATIVWLLVPWVQDILDKIDNGCIKLDEYDLSQWRLMHIGAQPVPQSLIHRWQKVFPNHLYDTNYGLSESLGPGCVHLGLENIHKVGAIGKAAHNWDLKIADSKGNSVNQGDVGELMVKGPGVMKCYYNDPKATNEVLKDEWLLTGDMARMDEDEFVYLVDRKKDVVISGGENIYPVQIEDFIRRHNSVKDVAVIGLFDKRLGEIAAAIIELKSGFECREEEIMKFCEKLPRYKRPKKIFFDEIPRNPTGKIEKVKIREKYCAKSVVDIQNKY